MKNLVRRRFPRSGVFLLAAALLAGCQPAGSDGAVPEAPPVAILGSAGGSSGSTVVVLVRHAERSDQLRPGDEAGTTGTAEDPGLSRMGAERAQAVADLLVDSDFDHVWSTDYQRTRDTASPTATAAGLELEFYDPRDLPAFAESLTAMGGRHLVVGHSNTTPDMVTALGGISGGPIDEAEYDRIYVVTVSKDGSATSVLLRFGRPYEG